MRRLHPTREHWIVASLLIAFIPIGIGMSVWFRWMPLLLIALPGLIHLRVWRYARELVIRMTVPQYAGLAFVLLYVFTYLGTTAYKPYGRGGGLSGPLHVREFRSEYHLLPYYPLYLVERWTRNRSLTSATHHFNCDFSDAIYSNFWLYGDGGFTAIWYDWGNLGYSGCPSGFVFSVCLVAVMARGFFRSPTWVSLGYGLVIAFMIIAAHLAVLSVRFWAAG